MTRPVEAGAREADVCLVGFGRSGTNSLRDFFSGHPQIAWRRSLRSLLFEEHSQRVETDPFPEGAVCTVDVFEWYCLGVFRYGLAPGEWERLRFESPDTVADVRWRLDPETAAQRLREYLPKARIILVLREQAEWLLANYRAHVLNLAKGRTKFGDFLQSVEGLLLQEGGNYDRTIKLYQDLFGVEAVYVILSEAFRSDPLVTITSLSEFLKVESGHSVEQLLSNAGAPPVLVRVHQVLAGIPGEQHLARWVSRLVRRRGAGWAGRGSGWLSRSGISPLADAETLESLRERYAASNRRTVELTGLDLARHGYTL